MRLKDQVAIVTGGGGGIGEGISLCLSREGAHVVVSDLKLDLAEAVADKVRAQGVKALAVKTDVREEKECQALVDLALEKMGGLDILVCSAGVSGMGILTPSPETNLIENIPVESWDLTIDVNLKGIFLCNRAAIPHFKKQKRGKIVNVSSVAGRHGGATLPVYAASKAGVINLSQSVALQLAPYGVNVNTLCPGIIWTPMWAEGIRFIQQMNPALKEMSPRQAWEVMARGAIPFGRPQTTEDMGNAVVFLVSDEAREITGQALNVDGGTTFN